MGLASYAHLFKRLGGGGAEYRELLEVFGGTDQTNILLARLLTSCSLIVDREYPSLHVYIAHTKQIT